MFTKLSRNKNGEVNTPSIMSQSYSKAIKVQLLSILQSLYQAVMFSLRLYNFFQYYSSNGIVSCLQTTLSLLQKRDNPVINPRLTTTLLLLLGTGH